MELLIQITMGEIGLILGSLFIFWLWYRLFDNIFNAMRKDLDNTIEDYK